MAGQQGVAADEAAGRQLRWLPLALAAEHRYVGQTGDAVPCVELGQTDGAVEDSHGEGQPSQSLDRCRTLVQVLLARASRSGLLVYPRCRSL